MRRYARLGAYVASVTLAVTTVTAIAPSAQADPVKDPIGVNAGASWLESQLTNGIVHNNQFNFDDYGLSVDIAFGLDAVGGHSATVNAVSTALSSKIDAYTKFGTHVFAGSLAKLGVLADITGDPTNYGSRNLVTGVNNLIATTGATGRLQDSGTTPADPDTANTIGQAFAARLLQNNGGSHAADAVNFLLTQQCSDGGFRLSLGTAACDSTAAQIDATSIALLQLKAINSPTSQVTTAISDATDYLVGEQQLSGAWGGDPGGAAANANATGLAAWALGDTVQSANGAAWLRDHQATFYDYCDALKTDVGTVAYSDGSLATGRIDGINAPTQDQFRRAAAQAVPGLQYLNADTTPSTPQLTGPAGYQKADSPVTFRATGVHAGDQLCLTGGPGGAGGVSSGTTWTTQETLPAGTATRTFAVRDRDGHSDSTTVTVLGAKNLPLTRSKYRNHRSSFVTVTIYGLAPGERASILFRGVRKASGTADSVGHFRRSIWTGRKLGKGTIGAYGQFGDIRKAYTKIKVVR